MNNIFGFEISSNKFSSRIIDIKIKDEIIEKLIFPFQKFDLTAIEYKPFTRFTIAKSLDDLSENKLSKLLNKIIRDRSLGCFIVSVKNQNSNIDDVFLVKLSTALAYLIGNPNLLIKNKISIGKELSFSLDVRIGDKITIMSPVGIETIIGNIPKQKNFMDMH